MALAALGSSSAQESTQIDSLRERGKEFVVPDSVLIVDEDVHRGGNLRQFFFGGEAVGADFARAVFDLLEEAGNADFDEFIQVVGGDGQELDALEQGLPISRASSSTRRLNSSHWTWRLR